MQQLPYLVEALADVVPPSPFRCPAPHVVAVLDDAYPILRRLDRMCRAARVLDVPPELLSCRYAAAVRRHNTTT